MSPIPDGQSPHPAVDEEAVAAFLRTKGATRCPTAYLQPTQADISEADRVALRKHEERVASTRRLSVSRAGIDRGIDTRRKKSKEFLDALRPAIMDIMQTATGTSAIARELNARGIRTSLGSPWTEAAMRYALVNLGLRGDTTSEPDA